MKIVSFLCISLLLLSCSQVVNHEAEQKTIMSLLEMETSYASSGQLDQWANCWVQSDQASLVYAGQDGSFKVDGFDALKAAMTDVDPFKIQLKRENYQFSFSGDLAYVSYDQYDNWGPGENRHKLESRVLQKVDGQWKVLNTTVVDLASYERPDYASYHLPVTAIPPHPLTGTLHQHNVGGMTIGYLDIPAGSDFTPLFKGLPHDLCNSPHWGYLIDGSIDIIYHDGQSETINKGEIFYLPALHTGKTAKGAKLVDFSPDDDMYLLLETMGQNMQSMQAAK